MKKQLYTILLGAALTVAAPGAAMAADEVPTIYAGSTTDVTYASSTIGLVAFTPSADNAAITPVTVKEQVGNIPSVFGTFDSFTSSAYNAWQPWSLMSGVLKDGQWIGYYGLNGYSSYACYYKAYDVSADDPEEWSAVTGTTAKDNVYKVHTNTYSDGGWFARDATYDAVSGKIYTAHYMSNSSSYFGAKESGMTIIAETEYNGYDDPQTRTNKTRVSLGEEYLAGLAANAQGHLYGIGDEGTLVRINDLTTNPASVENGAISVVTLSAADHAKLRTSSAMGSATFDPNTGKLYYVVRSGGNSNSVTASVQNTLVEITIDEETNSATVRQVGTLPSGQLFTGLFIKPKAKAAGSPAAVTALAIDDAGKTVSFTLPDADTNGDALAGTLTYTVTINGVEVTTGSGTPGENISESVSVTEGAATIVVVVSAGELEGTPVAYTTYIGTGDTPQTVTGLTMTQTDGQVSLSWTAPAEGVNGGKLVADKLLYIVTRYASNAANGALLSSYKEDEVFAPQSALTFTDVVNPDITTHYRYAVAAVNGDRQGAQVTTDNYFTQNPVYGIPFDDNFADRTTFENAYFVGTSEQGSWAYNSEYKTVAFEGDNTAEKNASVFLITPKLPLDGGQEYHLAMHFSSRDNLSSILADGVDEADFLATLRYNFYLTQATTGKAVESTELIGELTGRDVVDGGVFTLSFTAPSSEDYSIAIEAANTTYERESSDEGSTELELAASAGITLTGLSVSTEPYVEPSSDIVVEISEAGWASFVNWDWAVDLPADAEAYILTAFSAEGARIEAIRQVPQATPVLLSAAEGEVTLAKLGDGITDDSVWDVIYDAEGHAQNLLQASDGLTTVGDGLTTWGLAYVDGVVGFRRVAAGSYIPDGKVFVVASLATSRTFVPLTGDATAIERVKAAVAADASAAYDVAGRRVAPGAKGLVIVGGRKTVRR